MEVTQFINEHLLPGQIGHLLVIIAFIGSLLSSISYFLSTKSKTDVEEKQYIQLGRYSFFTMFAAVLGIAASLFFIIYNHYFEYQYAWRHSSKELPTHYMISCFWEGQEGSFLLWSFWQSVLGLVLIFTSKSWESRVMTVVALSQFFLTSMLLGVYVFDFKLGSNPFELLRLTMQNAPIFKRADYLSMIPDGNGLNPLLQNYWMVIHPPILFLGFSSTIVPFAFAIAGWWKQDFNNWIKAVFPWALFSGFALSMGIMMGAAWAYEALTFGGYWAWDPVENASIMPWITLVAGIHALLAYKHSGQAQTATFLLFSGTFIFTLYASFLTRSGILGETSVHAFTDLGLGGQLVFYLLAFIAIASIILILNFKKAPKESKDESAYSREFWLFIATLVFLVSLVQITFTTSIPVFNKLFKTNWAPPSPIIAHYNKIQIWIGIMLTLLSAFVQYFKYKETDFKKFIQKIIPYKVAALIITAFLIWNFQLNKIAIWIFLFGSIFTVLANSGYFIQIIKGKIKIAGGSVAHIGFGLMMIGVIITGTKQEVISFNHSGIDLGDGMGENKDENILLNKNVPMQMGDYWLTYKGDSTNGPNIYYQVHYVRKNQEGKVIEEFDLYPNAQINPKMGLISSPDTRHYFSKDIYTHVTSVPNNKEKDNTIHEKDYASYTVKMGDTVHTKNASIILMQISSQIQRQDVILKKSDIAVSAKFKILTSNTSYDAEAVYLIRDNMAVPIEAEETNTGIHIFINQILTKENKLELGIAEKTPTPQYIVLKALVFPYINVLWIGTVILLIGFVISMLNRRKQAQTI